MKCTALLLFLLYAEVAVAELTCVKSLRFAVFTLFLRTRTLLSVLLFLLLVVKAHCEGDTVALEVNIKHAYLYDLVYLYGFKRVLDELVAYL